MGTESARDPQGGTLNDRPRLTSTTSGDQQDLGLAVHRTTNLAGRVIHRSVLWASRDERGRQGPARTRYVEIQWRHGEIDHRSVIRSEWGVASGESRVRLDDGRTTSRPIQPDQTQNEEPTKTQNKKQSNKQTNQPPRSTHNYLNRSIADWRLTIFPSR